MVCANPAEGVQVLREKQDVTDAIQLLLLWPKQFAAPILVRRIRKHGCREEGIAWKGGERLGEVNPWIPLVC